MPTSDRRGRARRKADELDLSGTALHKAMHDAVGNPDAWAALRSRAIRGMTHASVTAEQAARMFDAFGRKPYLIPRLPPQGLIADDTLSTGAT